MSQFQFIFLALLLVFVVAVFTRSLHQCRRCNNSFGLTPGLFILGIFVWADAVIIAPFWMLTVGFSLLLQSWWLFLVFTGLFWVVRSLGETMYWFNQQFASVNRNPVENLLLSEWFDDDAIWFVYQIFWQSVTVFSLVASIYSIFNWLQTL